MTIVLAIRLPYTQQKITNYATNYISDKTNTNVSIKRLFITFSGNVQLEGLYAEDQESDTLIYSKVLETGLSIKSLWKGNYSISKLHWEGLKAKVVRKQDSSFNFDFIIDALSNSTNEQRVENENNKGKSSLPEIELGPVSFDDFDLIYNDELSGMEMDLKLGSLELYTKTIDLDSLSFQIEELNLSGTQFTYVQTKEVESVPESDEDTTSTLPFIEVDELAITNSNVFYKVVPDSMEMSFDLSDIGLTRALLNLTKQKIEVNDIWLRSVNSSIQMASTTEQDSSAMNTTSTNRDTTDIWPDWQLAAKSLEIGNNAFAFKQGDSTVSDSVFNPTDIDLSDLNITINNFSYSPRNVLADVNNISFLEKCGLELNSFSAKIEVHDHQAGLRNVMVSTAGNTLYTDLELNYNAIDSLFDNPLAFDELKWSFEQEAFSIKEAFFFAPDLKKDTSIQKLIDKRILAKGKVEGNLNALTIQNLQAQFGKQSNINTSGKALNLMDSSQRKVVLETIQVNAYVADVKEFGLESYPKSYPQRIQLSGSAQYSAKKIAADLESHLGNKEGYLKIKGEFLPAEQEQFKAEIDAKEIHLAKWLQDSTMTNSLAIDLKLDGKGLSLDKGRAKLKGTINGLKYKNYDYETITIDADKAGEQVTASVIHQDDNLDVNADFTAQIDTLRQQAEFSIAVKKGDLLALGLSQSQLEMILNLNGRVSSSPNRLSLDVSIKEGKLIQEGQIYPVGDFEIEGFTQNDSTHFDWESRSISAHLDANAGTDIAIASIQNHLYHYFNQEVDSIKQDSSNVKVNFNLKAEPSPLITEILVPKIRNFEPLQIEMQFDESKEDLMANVSLPLMEYGDIVLDSLQLNLTANKNDLSLTSGFAQIDAGYANLYKTALTADLVDEKLLFQLFMEDHESDSLFHIGTDVTPSGDTLLAHINHENLLLNGLKWTISPDNEMSWSEDHIVFSDFTLKRNGQSLAFVSATSEEGDQKLSFKFDQFKLETLLSLVNPEKVPVTGVTQGQVSLLNLFDKPSFSASLDIADMYVMEQKAGNLSLKGNNKSGDLYDFNLSLEGPANLEITGEYSATSDVPTIDLALNLQKVSLDLIAPFSEGTIKESDGYLSGNINLNGPLNNPNYDGSLQFDNASVLVATTNSRFTLPNEQIRVQQEKISFNGFTIKDENQNNLILDGTINTTELTNPSLDLSVEANNFLLLNSDEEDNELFYGKALIDADIDITGTVEQPNVKAKLGLNKDTDFTYVIPESELDLVKREGIVEFADVKQKEDSLLVQGFTKDSLSQNTEILGLQLQAVVSVDKATNFTIVVDKRSGDYLAVQGEGDLSLDMNRNGVISLSGSYQVADGTYQLSMYELVKRKFDIASGSRIVWSGDPFNAKLDLTALYKLETSPSSLMATQISGESESVQNQYNQALGFIVQLNIDGELTQPEISFGLDMPESARSGIGQNVYSNVQQLNRNENELNKQVFSLLVFNRFFPAGSSSPSFNSGEIARSSASQLLSNQLNSLSDRFVKGVDLNFDLDSYKDYQSGSAEDRTQLNIGLSKSLFNDRFRVQVGSQVDLEGQQRTRQSASDIIGDITLEYLLTESGRYRLTGFRKNQYEGFIDGQVVSTGFSFLFNREFNEFSELFSSEEEEKEKDETLKQKEVDNQNKEGRKEDDEEEKEEGGQSNE